MGTLIPSITITMLCKVSIVLAVVCLGAVLAQAPTTRRPRPSWFDILAWRLNGLDDTVDRIHDYRIECHFIEIDPQWEPLLQDPHKLQLISEEIYHLVHDGHVPETELTADQLLAKYDDHDAVEECTRHTVKVMDYTPSPSIRA